MIKYKSLFYIVILCLLLPLTAHAYVDPGRPMLKWKIIPEKSFVTWSVKYSGQEVKGTFPDMKAEIAFDEKRLHKSQASIQVSMSKVRSADKDAEENLPTGEWLNAIDYPVAIFSSTNFQQIQGEQYSVLGEFIFHGFKTKITVPLTIHFSINKETFVPTRSTVVDGQFTLNRLDFKVGQGDWAKTDTLSNEVKVGVHIEAVEQQM